MLSQAPNGLNKTPNWENLLKETYVDPGQETLLLKTGATIKPTTHSIRVGKQQLDLPRHNISPENEVVDFQILSTLGRGGMGVVHLARQRALGRDVAIKQLTEDMLSPSTIQSLLREACITGRLEHPNIVPVYSLGMDEQGRPLFVMKRIEGVSWQDALADARHLPRAYRKQEDVLESHLDIFENVCLAMHYAHSKGIIHRDLKPENVMLGDFGEVYVVDWGIAVALVPDEGGVLPLAREVNHVAGTPMYMAPEQAAAEGALINVHTDVYALGAILHELLTGSPRHTGRSLHAVLLHAYHSAPHEYSPEVDEELARICNKACARDPHERYASAELLREAISSYREKRQAGHLLKASKEHIDTLRAIAKQSLDEGSVTSGHMVQAYALVGACRFALEQAKKLNPNLDKIKRRKTDMLNTMLTLEVVHENLAAAHVLEQELGEDISLENKAKLNALECSLQAEQKRIESLEELEHGISLGVSRKRKGILVFVLCIIWTSAAMISHFLVGAKDLPQDVLCQNVLIFKSVVTTLVLIVWFLARKFIVLNLINRKLLAIIPAILVIGLIARALSWKYGLDITNGVSLEMFSYGVIGFMMGVLLEKWFHIIGAIYVLGASLIVVLGGHAPWILVVCNFVALSSVGWRWFTGKGQWGEGEKKVLQQ